MKKILTLVLACTSVFSFAQKKSTLSRCIEGERITMASPKPELPPIPPFLLEPEVYVSIDVTPEITQSGDSHGRTFQGLDSAGYRKHVKYNPQTGELFLQYHFKKNDEEFVYEKTINAAEKSDTERQRIIDRFENEIELPGKGMEM
ncbi:hypothetical protein DYBT9623_02409 [Dyadobacter sp. CECT 9623]|uniref:Uncharacterized protein n=1 Tax=Dyadobacter linearis TaxID=2823330 RepID=A0ABM8UQD6_9BACT|nr:hypothetical protein [Dyadobacter sp. CECT 9623]CAG5069673.1 hypothetical protein DYBT9623_02409 [Dyadobacter sp. CECT 9623]